MPISRTCCSLPSRWPPTFKISVVTCQESRGIWLNLLRPVSNYLTRYFLLMTLYHINDELQFRRLRVTSEVKKSKPPFCSDRGVSISRVFSNDFKALQPRPVPQSRHLNRWSLFGIPTLSAFLEMKERMLCCPSSKKRERTPLIRSRSLIGR